MSVKKEYETVTRTITENVLVSETIICDVCSGECLRKKFDEYIEESGNGANTMCFEAERQ